MEETLYGRISKGNGDSGAQRADVHPRARKARTAGSEEARAGENQPLQNPFCRPEEGEKMRVLVSDRQNLPV